LVLLGTASASKRRSAGELERRNADLERRSCGKSRIDSAPARDAVTGAALLSGHDFKIFDDPELRSLHPHETNPAVSVRSQFRSAFRR